MTLSTIAEQQAFQSVKRACYAGLDSVTLRVEVARRVERVVPADESYFWTLDPETGLVNHGVARGQPNARIFSEFVGHHYPDDEAASVIDQARAGLVIKRGAPEAMRPLLESEGIHQDIRALFFTPEAFWGSWCILRGAGPDFTSREARFLERIAPHVAEGLKGAALLELGSSGGELAEEPDSGPASASAPGFLVLGPTGDVTLRTAAVAPYLADLTLDGVADDGQAPYPVFSVRGRLLRVRATADEAPGDARLRARGRSGTWYSLRATLTEPDASGRSSVLVAIEPAARHEVAPLLFRLYGLSPREREVLVWVIRGEPTKGIAARLGLSTHTVQDYLDKACEKVGVRGRKALIAKLFQDGFAPKLIA